MLKKLYMAGGKAVEKMTNSKRGCQYCRGKDSTWAENLHPMPDYDTLDELYGLSIERYGKYICFDADYPESGDMLNFKISYCPFCGRKLGDE